jgi:hypothetical protein
MLRLFEGVTAAVSVVLFLSWLLFRRGYSCRGCFSFAAVLSWLVFRRAAFFVVADSHSNIAAV